MGYYYYRKEGLAYLKAEKFDDAIVSYTKAIGIDPEDDDVYFYRGLAYSRSKQHEKALADYCKAIGLNPNNTAYYTKRGDLLIELQHFDRAISDFSHVIETTPSDPYAYYRRGWIYYDMEKYQLALMNFSKLAELHPDRDEIQDIITGLKRKMQDNLVNVNISSMNGQFHKLNELTETLNHLIGLEKVKREVTTLINLVLMNNKRKERGLKVVPVSLHLVFTGNPGTGKTMIARLLSRIYQQLGLLSKGRVSWADRA